MNEIKHAEILVRLMDQKQKMVVLGAAMQNLSAIEDQLEPLVECPSCSGRGEFEVCPDCGGEGGSVGEYAASPIAEQPSTRWIDCERCTYDDIDIDEETGRASAGRVQGSATCDLCDGKGKVPRYEALEWLEGAIENLAPATL